MIKTHGLTHISLKVSDMDKSVQFYKDVFGVVNIIVMSKTFK